MFATACVALPTRRTHKKPADEGGLHDFLMKLWVPGIVASSASETWIGFGAASAGLEGTFIFTAGSEI